jgi:hypothetical protein
VVVDAHDPIAVHEARGPGRRVPRHADDDGAGWFAGVGPRAESPPAAVQWFGYARLEAALCGRRFPAALGPEGRRRGGIVGDRQGKGEREPRDRLDAGEVHELDVVARPVVVVVQPRMEHDRGNAGHDEGVVIGVFLDLPIEGELEGRLGRRVIVGPHDRVAEPGGGATAVDLDAIAPQPADHVEVHAEHRIEVGERRGPHPHEVP